MVSLTSQSVIDLSLLFPDTQSPRKGLELWQLLGTPVLAPGAGKAFIYWQF